MNKTYFSTAKAFSVVSSTQYVPSYPWCLGTDDLPNPDDLADWD